MLDSYFSNKEVGMTKAQYLDMCERMGTEPLAHETPMEIGDFPPDIQLLFQIVNTLPDKFDGFSGYYMGKDFQLLEYLLDLYEVDDRKMSIQIIMNIINKQVSQYNAKKQRESKRKTKNKAR